MLPNEKISCVLKIWFLYTEFINFLLKFAVNAFQCCSSLFKYYSSESMLLLILSYVSSNMHVSLSFLKNSSFWNIRETQNKHLIIWKKLFEIYKFVFVMLNLLNSSLNSVRNLLKIHFVSKEFVVLEMRGLYNKDTSAIPQIVVRETWIWYTWPDRMTYTLMQMFRRYAHIGCKNEKVKIGEKKVSLDFCKLLPKEFWEETKKFFLKLWSRTFSIRICKFRLYTLDDFVFLCFNRNEANFIATLVQSGQPVLSFKSALPSRIQ